MALFLDQEVIKPVDFTLYTDAAAKVGYGGFFRKTLTRSFIIEKEKTLLLSLGYNPYLYSDHSFRIGAAITAAAAHIPDHMIRTLGRWKFDCYCRYIQTSYKSL